MSGFSDEVRAAREAREPALADAVRVAARRLQAMSNGAARDFRLEGPAIVTLFEAADEIERLAEVLRERSARERDERTRSIVRRLMAALALR